MTPRAKFAVALTLFTALLAVGTSIVFFAAPALAGGGAAAAPAGNGVIEPGMGYLAAALATGLSALAAGFAVAHVGSAAIGAITEKPELLGRMLILVGLAEGIAIYGLIISILILNRLG
ncbi:MAG: H+transporting two-sector ATPase C subunit [Magnetococcales bacterium]|nr:H+transporting two-sector ATPase C subunit [Magnetococcales bacterium]